MRKVFTVTPSFLLKLMKYCSQFEHDSDVINTFEKIAHLDQPLLTSENLDGFEQNADDDIPEHLEELRNALEGAIEAAEEED